MLKSACLALIAAAAISAPVFAQDIHLSFGDLNFDRPSDVQALSRRIDVEAKTWCLQQAPVTGSILRDTRCVASVTDTLVASLPAVARKAYAAAAASSPRQLAMRDGH